MISSFALRLYRFLKCRRIRGRGLFLKLAGTLLPKLRRWPLGMPGLPEGTLDLSLRSSLALLDASMGDTGSNKHLLRFLELALRAGDRLWDVGANVGVVTCHFCDPRHALSGIEAFEPNFEVHEILSRAVYGSPIAKTHPFALGDRNEQATLYVPGIDTSMASLVPIDQKGEGSVVSICTGDEHWRNSGELAPAAIKIDVEGFEERVLCGLSEMIRVARPVIIFEQIFLTEDQLQKHCPENYEMWFLGDQGELFTEMARRNEAADAIYLPCDKNGILSQRHLPIKRGRFSGRF